ncbi:MAG: hypothetical protein AB7S77_23090 [Desulfatirhabdiaceae bacterium]
MKRKINSFSTAILIVLMCLTLVPVSIAGDSGYFMATTGTTEQLTLTYCYYTGTDPGLIQYTKALFDNYSPVKVQFPSDLSTTYQTGYLVGTIYYPDLEPVTTEFLLFVAEVDGLTGKSNIYNTIIWLIEWLKQFVPEPAPDEVAPQSGVPEDFEGVVWLHANVSGWAQTSKLPSVKFTSTTITLDYDKTNVWPGVYIDGVLLNANPWIFVRLDGIWYAGTWEWLRPGQITKDINSVNGDHIKVPPLDEGAPVSGVSYGFMVSGLARTSERNVLERTNVVMAVWP